MRLKLHVFHMLLTLADAPLHGFGIKRAVERQTGGAIRLGPGTLYACLARLVEDGLVVQKPPAPDAPPTPGPASPTYSLTTAGRRALRAELACLETDVREARSVLGRTTGRARS